MDVDVNGRCSHCGEPIEPDAERCSACGAEQKVIRRSRFTIALLLILLIIGFTLTGFIARAYDARREQLADRWFGRGERNLQRGAALQAIDEFQTALAYSRENNTYRLELAKALMQAGKWEEARAHLLNLWEQRPGDAEVNLLLARVFAQRGLISNAVRYYHGAIYGVWESSPVSNRETARFELVELLLSHGQQQPAQSELIALASEPPENAAEQVRLANLMSKANEPQRALDIFQQVRRKDRENFDATLGAAQAEFALYRFASALALAKEAKSLRPDSDKAANLVTITDTLVQADPRARGINASERGRRAYAAFNSASTRLKSCTLANTDAHLQDLATQASNFKRLTASLLRDPDLRDQVVRWVYDVETTAAKVCGSPIGDDASLLLLAQAQERER